MFYSDKKKTFESVFVPASIDKLDMSLYVPVDQYSKQDFNLNEAGWIRDTISTIARAQTIEEYNALVSRLTQVAAGSSLPDDLTDQQAFDMIKPRYSQSNQEIQQYIEFTNGSFAERVTAAYKKALGKSTDKSVDKPDVKEDTTPNV